MIVQRWCRGFGEVLERRCRGGAEVLQVQRWCRGGALLIVQRWCSHSAYVGGAGAEEVIQSDYVEVVQRWCRCRGGEQRWCAEVVCRGGSKVVQMQRWWRAEVVVPRCKGGEELVHGAEVVVQSCCWFCGAGGANCRGGADMVKRWCRGVIVQKWCRGGAEVVQRLYSLTD